MKTIMLALSTFRHSEKAIKRAFQLAGEGSSKLVIAYVVDINLARYFIGSDIVAGTELRRTSEKELLKKFQEDGKKALFDIQSQARSQDIECTSYLSTGRFAIECLSVVNKENPDFIITTRSNRPKWVRRFFGSPVDTLIKKVKCPVEMC